MSPARHLSIRATARIAAALFVLGAILLLAACDTVEPDQPGRLVVEGFLDTGEPLPAIRLRSTRALDARFAGDTGVADAAVMLTLDGRVVEYAADTTQPGRYVSARDDIVLPAHAPFEVDIEWRGQHVSASDRLPPAIAIDSVRFHVATEPVAAVLLDSLRLDSLQTGAREGFIYPIDVDVFWATPFAETGRDSTYWIRPHLKPHAAFQSISEGFFVREDQLLRERTLPKDPAGRRQWTGVYAVPVDTRETPLPPHELTVALLRSGPDYARFAASRDAPDRREPLSNVDGGLGIVAGISVDSLRVQVP